MSAVPATEPAGLAPEVLAGLGALARVGRALTSAGSLADVSRLALAEMRDALSLELAVLYLPDEAGHGRLRQAAVSAAAGTRRRALDELELDPEAWRLAVASGLPLVFREPASWLGPNPFEPSASHWLVLPLARAGRQLGMVAAAASGPVALDPPGTTILTLLGDQLGIGIATAAMRGRLQRMEVERERFRLAAEVHDGLAQDLALALREIALLSDSPTEVQARESLERLREAVGSAHRLVRARLEDLAVCAPEGGLPGAVREICDRHARAGLPLALSVSGAAVEVSPEATAVAVRVLGESLTNVLKHAQASRVDVSLRLEGDRAELTVADDGVGFDVARVDGPGDGCFGLTVMRARARAAGASLEIDSGQPRGTRVVLLLPCTLDS